MTFMSVIWYHLSFFVCLFVKNSRPKRTRDVGVIYLCSSRHDTSTDMHVILHYCFHALFLSAPGTRRRCGRLRCRSAGLSQRPLLVYRLPPLGRFLCRRMAIAFDAVAPPPTVLTRIKHCTETDELPFSHSGPFILNLTF